MKVGVSRTRKHNLGNYESTEVGAWLEADVPEGTDPAQALRELQVIVDAQVASQDPRGTEKASPRAIREDEVPARPSAQAHHPRCKHPRMAHTVCQVEIPVQEAAPAQAPPPAVAPAAPVASEAATASMVPKVGPAVDAATPSAPSSPPTATRRSIIPGHVLVEITNTAFFPAYRQFGFSYDPATRVASAVLAESRVADVERLVAQVKGARVRVTRGAA
jgi:hypothetical protein